MGALMDNDGKDGSFFERWRKPQILVPALPPSSGSSVTIGVAELRTVTKRLFDPSLGFNMQFRNKDPHIVWFPFERL